MNEKLPYKIVGLDCAEEVAVLKKVLDNVDGVFDLEFNILQSKMTVICDTQKISSEKIIDLVSSTGLKAIPWSAQSNTESTFWERNGRWILTFLSFLFLVAGTLSHYLYHRDLMDLFGEKGGPLPLVPKLLYLASIICGVIYVIPKAYFSIKSIQPDINLLMILAIVGACILGDWFEGGSVAFLFSLSLFLEQWSVSRARKAISSLVQLSPTLARVIHQNGDVEEKNVGEVSVGTKILIRPGEKIPLDAVIVKGISSIDQSPITGESLPISKNVGDEVFAGTLNEEGVLECEVTKEVEDTTLARMIRLVEEAKGKRSESQQWVEKFAKVYTPIMLFLALAIMIFPPVFLGASATSWIYRGLVLLVIACPCALVIATPVANVSGLTTAAREGILIKGGIYLEQMGSLKALALDKTGTLTYGHPEVQQVVPVNHHTSKELLERAAALEVHSQHPLARAILKKAKEENVPITPAENYQILVGKGAQGFFQNQLFWIGSHRLMHERGQETPRVHEQALQLEDAGHTIVAIGNSSHVCGLISVADSPRKWVRKTIESIKAIGVKEIVMLTGDNEPTARALANFSGVDTFYAELLPEDKVKVVDQLQKKWGSVAMVGDGVNDAPAMASATLGIAMGGIGSAAALETAQIALMSDDLSKLPWLMILSRRVLRTIKQNIGFALAVKLVFLILALFNLTTLWMAIGADTGATLLVVFNALRLLRKIKQ